MPRARENEDLLVTGATQRRIAEVMRRSRWIRFSLTLGRGRWCAVFYNERGRIYGKGWAGDPTAAVAEAHREAIEKTAHLKEK